MAEEASMKTLSDRSQWFPESRSLVIPKSEKEKVEAKLKSEGWTVKFGTAVKQGRVVSQWPLGSELIVLREE